MAEGDVLDGTTFKSTAREPTGTLQLIVRGPEKVGKTYTSLLTCPEPVAYLNGDRPNEYMLSRIAAQRKLLLADYFGYRLPGIKNVRSRMEGHELRENNEKNAAVVRPVMKRWLREFRVALRSGARSVVVDTGGWVYDSMRLAKYGTLTIPQHLAPEYKAEMDSIMHEADGRGKLVVWIHRVADEWENYTDEQGKEKSRTTGGQVTKGYKEAQYCVSAVVEMGWDLEGDGKRFAKIVSGEAGVGKVFKGSALTVPEIAAAVTRLGVEKWK